MNGGHDLGGMHGLGAIRPEPEGTEPVFHADWERRVFGMVRVLGPLGQWTSDMARFARERQHPAAYLQHSYYENWLAGLEKLLVEKGLITAEELASGKSAGSADAALRSRCLRSTDLDRALQGSSSVVEIADIPRFRIGERVRAINRHPIGHTREPRYVRGRLGTIHAHCGAHLFPDESARGQRVARHLYNVRFEASDLWGSDAEPGSVVHIDLWQDYLEPA
jgi:nitrile hydratase